MVFGRKTIDWQSRNLVKLVRAICYLWEPLYSFWVINVNVQFQFTKALLQSLWKRMHCPLNIHLALSNKFCKWKCSFYWKFCEWIAFVYRTEAVKSSRIHRTISIYSNIFTFGVIDKRVVMVLLLIFVLYILFTD